MTSLKEQSPLGKYVEHLNKGELAYQVSKDGSAVFYPRVIAPKTGSPELAWKVSKGLGTVHATTVVMIQKDAPPYNVALIDVDEGFRMMSRVEDIDPLQVKIGMRVKFRTHTGTDKDLPYAVFTPAEGKS